MCLSKYEIKHENTLGLRPSFWLGGDNGVFSGK